MLNCCYLAQDECVMISKRNEKEGEKTPKRMETKKCVSCLIRDHGLFFTYIVIGVPVRSSGVCVCDRVRCGRRWVRCPEEARH